MYEIQFHPADIRKPVRYFFLSRQAFHRLAAVAAVLLTVVVLGLLAAPLGIQSLVLTSRLRVARHNHRTLEEIFEQRRSALERLASRAKQAHMRERQIALILGAELDGGSSGGFPKTSQHRYTVPELSVGARLADRLETQSEALLAVLRELEEFAKAHNELTHQVPSICPLQPGSFVLTSPFGERTSPFTGGRDFHSGIDLAAREGTPVMSTGDGRVVFAGRYPLRRNVRWWRFGNLVVVQHGRRYLTIYAHLEEVAARRGQRVRRGQVVGTVGNTGWSTSPHLHYEVRVRQGNDEPIPVDPRIFILNYQWHGHEKLLVASRWAPPPRFDPLPRIFRYER